MNLDELHNRNEVIKTLREADSKYPLLEGLVYRSLFGFVADHGRFYDVKPWDGSFEKMPEKRCHANAFQYGLPRGLRYVEGITVAPDLKVFLHAWNVDDAGNVIDTTWMNSGLMYCGVEFSYERADDAMWNGDACILNDENRNYPVFQKRWTGEDFSLVWPYSDRMEAYRSGRPWEAASVRELIRKSGREEELCALIQEMSKHSNP